MRVSVNELLSIIAKTNATSIEMLSTTAVKMTKRNNVLADANVVKVKRAKYVFNASYESLVAESAHTDFTAQQLPWGHWLIDNKVIEHNNVLYLRCYNVIECIKSDILVNNHSATDEEFDIIAEHSTSKSHIAKTQQNVGLTDINKVTCTNVKFNNINYVVIDNVKYELALQNVRERV